MGKLYLVTCNGCIEDYGSEIYCVGVFDDEDKAKEAANNARNVMADIFERCGYSSVFDFMSYLTHGNAIRITEISLNAEYPMIKDDSYLDNCHNDNYLGGYTE